MANRSELRALAEDLDRAELASLAELSGALLGSLDPATLCDVFLAGLVRVVASAHALVLDLRDECAVVVATWDAPHIQPGTRYLAVAELRRRLPALVDGTAIYIPEAVELPGMPESFPEEGTPRPDSRIALSLAQARNRTSYVLVADAAPWAFSARQIRLVEAGGRLLAQALANADAYAAERQRANRLAAVQSVTAALSAVTTPAQVVEVIVRQGCVVLGAAGGVVRLLTEDGIWLERLDSVGYDPTVPRSPDRMALADQQPICEAVRTNQPIWLPTHAFWRERYPGTIPPFAKSGHQSGVALPLELHGRMHGALALSFAEVQAFATDDREFILTIAQLTAQALDRALLFETERERATQLATLQAVTETLAGVREPGAMGHAVVEQALAMLGATAGTVRLLSDDGATLELVGVVGHPSESFSRYRRLRLDESLPLCAAARSGTAIWIEDREEWKSRFPVVPAGYPPADYPAGAALPLIADGRPFGVLTWSFSAPRHFRAADKRLMIALSQQAAQAMQRTLLQAEEERRAAVMAQVSLALSSPLDPATLYDTILEQAERLLPFDHATILLYDGGVATVAASRGSPRLPPGATLPLDRFWLQPTDAMPAHLGDTDEDPRWCHVPPLEGEYRIRSTVSAPLVINGELVGTFDISSRTPHCYLDWHLQIVAHFGIHATQALRNTRLYVAEQARARAAEELARLRSDFVAAVSHELRTPLTSIIGFAEILRARWSESTDTQRLSWLDKIRVSAMRQQRLVEDLLLDTRMDLGVAPKKRDRCDLSVLALQAMAEVAASYRGQQIEQEGTPGLAVLADAGRALQILVNLLDNAAKYSLEGSPIEIVWTAEDDRGVVRVRDRGPGIPSSGRDRLFQRFGRLEGSRTRAGRVGTGLGLYLGRKLAESMGGDLELEETGPGGSTFRLRLPVAVDTGPEAGGGTGIRTDTRSLYEEQPEV